MFGYINVVNLVIYAEVVVMAHILSAYLPKRKNYAFRIVVFTSLGAAATYLLPVLYSESFWLAWLYSFFMYVFILLAALITVAGCIEASWINYLFCAVGGYAFHHLSSTLQGIIERIIWKESTGLVWQLPFMLAYLLSSAVVITFLVILIYKRKDIQTLVNRRGVIMLAAIIVILNIAISSLIMLANAYQKMSILDGVSEIYNFITSILAIFILFGMLERGHLEHEVEVINQLYKENIRQYELSKATMESLHDLKHRVNSLVVSQAGLSEEERKEITDKVFLFDSLAKTGNETLDIILTEKSMLCHQYGIQFNCMADGQELNFMEIYDIYSLFGNALSNAIEAVNKLSDDSVKLIFLGIKKTGNYLSIHLENTFQGDISMSDGIPVTSKEDSNAHGFGMKSMIRIAGKYKGKVTFTVNDELFCLDILFPIK